MVFVVTAPVKEVTRQIEISMVKKAWGTFHCSRALVLQCDCHNEGSA